MEIYKAVNCCTKTLEFLVISTVVSFYLLSIYDTITSSSVIIPLYFILLSMYYYFQLLTKSPGALLDFNHAHIKGLCKKCNRIVGNRTTHCEICNKCYHKRDHHCVITGKCIASNNSSDLFYTVFFLFIYTILALNRTTVLKEFMFFYKYMCLLSFSILLWVTSLLLVDKTTKELFKMNTSVFREIKYRRLCSLLDDGILTVLCPMIKKKSRVVS
ncbi:Palmitoyltransferase PFA3 [Nosema granulosis]|uniref:Palmitoyltransferase n=1 Tax=Nosema granulosis TaxID=83296 RepID=A0A9P6GZS1_9MICR|nr:Palmitoyltransferase PFA3 [Nosema granulosis]